MFTALAPPPVGASRSTHCHCAKSWPTISSHSVYGLIHGTNGVHTQPGRQKIFRLLDSLAIDRQSARERRCCPVSSTFFSQPRQATELAQLRRTGPSSPMSPETSLFTRIACRQHTLRGARATLIRACSFPVASLTTCLACPTPDRRPH